MDDRFEWDPKKARTNLRKHAVSFEEAATTFNDPHLTEPVEDESSPDEQRWVVFGESVEGKLLRVVYTERGTKLRLISAKKVTPRQRQVYEEG
jgi:hypothetical protein